MLKATYNDPAIEGIYGSPARSRGRNSSTSPDQHAGRVLLVTYTSPSNKQQLGGIVLPRSTTTNSSPGSERLKLIHESPSWRPTQAQEESIKREDRSQVETFVKRAGNEVDDVFGSPGKVTKSPDRGEPFVFSLVTPLN